MNLTIENILLVGSILLFISIIVGKTSYKFGVPTLLLFLAIGMLAGSDGIGQINFDNPKLAQFIGVVALNFILFSGGLDTGWNSVKPILKQGLMLSSVGVLITAMSVGTFIYFISDQFTLFESLLIGSIISSTDAAAVFSILRSKSLALKANIRPILEMESGSNDPTAYVLTIAFISLVSNPDQGLFSVVILFVQQMTIGAIAGYGFGRLSKIIINNIRLDFEGLYPVLVIALMFITFSATDFIGGNGFLAIYIAAVYLGNQDLIHKKTIFKMYDGLAWLMQIVLFLTLGLLVFPTQMFPYIGLGLLISLFLILIARPLSVFISLSPFKMKRRTKLYISWVGLRGAVPIVFATYPLIAGIEKADIIFNIVFFISVTSVLIQGTTLSTVANWLGVSLPQNVKQMTETDKIILDLPKSSMREFVIGSDDLVVNKRIVDLKMPRSTFIVMIVRDGEYLRPGGSTEIRVGDTLFILADNPEDYTKIEDCIRNVKSVAT